MNDQQKRDEWVRYCLALRENSGLRILTDPYSESVKMGDDVMNALSLPSLAKHIAWSKGK